MGCCASNKIEHTVISKAEKEELLNKTLIEISTANELKIIDLESINILDYLVSKTPPTHTSFIEYLLYFLNTLHEHIHNASQKLVKDLDPQALQVIRINLQKLNALLKGEGEFHQIKEDQPNGVKIHKILQEFDLNVMVIIQGRMTVNMTNSLIQEKEKLFDSSRFSFILASSFWVENLGQTKEQSMVKWCDFKEKFINFAGNYFKITIKPEDLALIRREVDKEEEQIVNYKDWDNFYKKDWVNWKTRKQFLEQKGNSKENEISPNQLNVVCLNYSNNALEISYYFTLKANEQYFSKNSQRFKKNLYEENLQLDEINLNGNEENMGNYGIFMKRDHKFYLENEGNFSAKYLLGLGKIGLLKEMVLQAKTFKVRVEKIEENSLGLEIYDQKFNLLENQKVTLENYKENVMKFGFPCDFNLEKENNVWVISRGKEPFLCDEDNVYVFLVDFSEIRQEHKNPIRSREINAGMTLNLEGGSFFILTEGEYVEPKLSKLIEKGKMVVEEILVKMEVNDEVQRKNEDYSTNKEKIKEHQEKVQEETKEKNEDFQENKIMLEPIIDPTKETIEETKEKIQDIQENGQPQETIKKTLEEKAELDLIHNLEENSHKVPIGIFQEALLEQPTERNISILENIQEKPDLEQSYNMSENIQEKPKENNQEKPKSFKPILKPMTLHVPQNPSSPFKKKLSKSSSVNDIITTSKGQKININIVNRIQLLEKLFTGSMNQELPIEEEEKNESPVCKKSASRRKRSGSLEHYVKSVSGKKSVHVNILDRVILLEKHFGSIDQIGGFANLSEINKEEQEKEEKMERVEEEEIYGPNGLMHWTMGRPKHPYRHKKKTMIKRALTRKSTGET